MPIYGLFMLQFRPTLSDIMITVRYKSFPRNALDNGDNAAAIFLRLNVGRMQSEPIIFPLPSAGERMYKKSKQTESHKKENVASTNHGPKMTLYIYKLCLP